MIIYSLSSVMYIGIIFVCEICEHIHICAFSALGARTPSSSYITGNWE